MKYINIVCEKYLNNLGNLEMIWTEDELRIKHLNKNKDNTSYGKAAYSLVRWHLKSSL